MNTTEKTEARRAFGADERIQFERAADISVFFDAVNKIEARYSTVKVAVLGETVMGRSIPVITLGKNRESRGVLYVGGMHGTDLYTSAVLMRFIKDYAEFLEAGKRMYGVSMPYLYSSRTIHIIPMLNPDGYAIRKTGVSNIPIADRLIKINDNSSDFTKWQYNARGVDLRQNFIHCKKELPKTSGLSSESEPETSALCKYIKMAENGVIGRIELALELNSDNNYIRCTSGEVSVARSKTLARLLSRMTGCSVDKHSEAECGLTDLFLRQIERPAFSCGCLNEGLETESLVDEYLRIYAAFREVLFSTPLLI